MATSFGVTKNSYNIGDICWDVDSYISTHSGTLSFSGVLGENFGELRNCYSAGNILVSNKFANTVNIGGVAGLNYKTAEKCYFFGYIATNPAEEEGYRIYYLYVGGITTFSSGNAVLKDCFYNNDGVSYRAILNNDNEGDNVKGLPKEKMVGFGMSDCLENLSDGTYVSEEWIFREKEENIAFLPHLKGFSYDTSEDISDWPVKIRRAIIKLDSLEKTYDGTGMKDVLSHVSVTGLADGDILVGYALYGNSAEAGVHVMTMEQVGICNRKNHIDVTFFYDIVFDLGAITVTPRELTITADDASKVYDGTELTAESYIADGLVEGQQIESVTITGSQTDPGTCENVPSDAVIVNAAGKDVSSNYSIIYVNGTLTVEKCPALESINNDAKPVAKVGLVYDGTAQELLTAPKTLPDEYGKIEYSLNGTDWSESIPTGTEAAEYMVYVRYVGPIHADFIGETITVKINGRLCSVVWTDSEGEELDSAEYFLGEPEAVTDIVPTMEEDEDYTYAFDHWEAVYDEDNVKIYMPSFRAIPKELYGVTGGVIEWKKGSGKNAGLTIKRALDDETCFGHFSGLEIDEIMLTINKDYTVKRGSTIITIMSAYLETLGEGDHKVKAVFDDGEVTADMDILEADPTPSNTPTEVPTSTPIPTSTPTTEPTSTPTDTPEVTLTPIPEPTSTPIPTPTPEIDPAPKTGDTGNVWIWAVLAVLASVSIGGALVERRVRGENRG